MATATFHHLNTRRLALHSSGSYGSGSSHTLSKQSKFPVSGTNILGFARNVDDTINTQASYKYFVNLEEEVAKRKNKRGVAMKEQQEAEAGKETKQAPSRADPSGANINGNLEHETVQETLQTTVTEDGSAKHQETPSPVGRDEGKGKVTFDVKPTVIVTEDDGKVEEDVTIEQDSDSGGKPIIDGHLKCANLDVFQKWCSSSMTWMMQNAQEFPSIDSFPFLNKLCVVRFSQGSYARRPILKPLHHFGLAHCLTLHIFALFEVTLLHT